MSRRCHVMSQWRENGNVVVEQVQIGHWGEDGLDTHKTTSHVIDWYDDRDDDGDA